MMLMIEHTYAGSDKKKTCSVGTAKTEGVPKDNDFSLKGEIKLQTVTVTTETATHNILSITCKDQAGEVYGKTVVGEHIKTADQIIELGDNGRLCGF